MTPEEILAELKDIRRNMDAIEAKYERERNIREAEQTIDRLLYALRDLMTGDSPLKGLASEDKALLSSAKFARTYGREPFLKLWAWMEQRKAEEEKP